MSGSVRIGAVAYLNSKPLIEGIEQLAPQCKLSLAVPSQLADQLASDQLDIALIPVIEYFRNPHYQLVSDACVSCRGPVRSVKLFSRVPIENISSLALDVGSRTSVGLIRLLLLQRYGVQPRECGLPMDAQPDTIDADAVLLIGDRAMQSPHGKWKVIWDLGEEWTRWTKLPFVFAVWVARPGIDLESMGRTLSKIRDHGVRKIESIAEKEGPLLGLSVAECCHYLSVHLQYHLHSQEREGLLLFETKLEEADLLEPNTTTVTRSSVSL